jgi:hypothetical protein
MDLNQQYVEFKSYDEIRKIITNEIFQGHHRLSWIK